MITENSFEQLSPEWFTARCGLPSASNFDKIVTMKGQPSKQAEKYMYQLAAERITGIKEEGYQNQAMQRGVEMEHEARQFYELATGSVVEQVGLIYPDEEKKYSCSPDGINGKVGLEIKCPLSHTHVEYLLKGKFPSTYFQQVQGSLLITRFESWDFLSYFPGMTPLLLTVERDEQFISALKEQLDEFCFKLAKITKQLKEMD